MTQIFKKMYVLIGIICLSVFFLPLGLSQGTQNSTEETTTEVTTEVTSETSEDAEAETTPETASETTTEQPADDSADDFDGETSESSEQSESTVQTAEDVEEVVSGQTDSDAATSENVTEEETSESSSTDTESASDELMTTDIETEESSDENASDAPVTEIEETTEGQAESTDEDVADTEVESTSEDANSEDTSAEEFTTEDIADEEATESETQSSSDDKANERVITVEYSGGNRKAVDFRYGPWIYTHPDAEGIIGRVGQEDDEDKDSQLVVYAQEAELKSPEDVLIATAGERVANFTGGVRVTRKRLTAIGEGLEYSEETGFGELTAEERIDITVLPKGGNGDITEITAESATFDVDTDVSVSRGGVTLESGSQSALAEEMTFEQGLDLAVMTNPEGQVEVKRSGDESDLIITADTVRVLTESQKLMAVGNVTLVDGAITTTGEIVFFDDEIERAEIFGTPDNVAVSIDSEYGVTLRGQRLEQLIDIDIVEILDVTAPSVWDEADFQLTAELSDE